MSRRSKCPVILFCTFFAASIHASLRPIELGLEHNEQTRSERARFEKALANQPESWTYFEQRFTSSHGGTDIRLRISKADLLLYDDYKPRLITCNITYSSVVPLSISYDLDSLNAVEMPNSSWHWLPIATDANLSLQIYAIPKEIGISYIRFRVKESRQLPMIDNASGDTGGGIQYVENVGNSTREFNTTEVLGFPLTVRRYKGVVQLMFRIVVILMVTLFVFTMGCELDLKILKEHIRRPVAPAIGFFCQFVIMPLLSFAIAMLIPIKKEFGFGLLTVGCSPGGGASNAWSLLLGGDINLSILMTFISSSSALFMMPLLLFIFGRFFIDVERVQIPYGNIAAQLLQISVPALAGLLLRWKKPKIAHVFTKLTRPFFFVFITFFLTYGVYANLSIFILLGSYPIIMPTSALLPWLGFGLAALIAYLLRQSRSVIITIALETGIQNMGAAILVLLYSMPQPAGDVGAIMPISVAMFTPVPLYFALLGLIIKKRCCKKTYPETSLMDAERYPNGDLKGNDEPKPLTNGVEQHIGVTNAA
ncbi:unnamed protein product [Calicophoron daubneyi]|uniref:Ileal sodium/bile acid cotransporter n=1 Tax=Calicophoron daubneyi TaxID=300641 RepID=A0AAV2TH95_CALDB